MNTFPVLVSEGDRAVSIRSVVALRRWVGMTSAHVSLCVVREFAVDENRNREECAEHRKLIGAGNTVVHTVTSTDPRDSPPDAKTTLAASVSTLGSGSVFGVLESQESMNVTSAVMPPRGATSRPIN